MPLPQDTQKVGGPRRRAAIACQSCNVKRIRCNAASAGLPCSNCRRSERNCQLIESRRGQRRAKSTTDPQKKATQKNRREIASRNPLTSDNRPTREAAILATRENHEESEDNGTEQVAIQSGDATESVQQSANLFEALRSISTERGQHSVVLPQTVDPAGSLAQSSHGKSLSIVDTLEVGQEEMDMLTLQHAFDVPNSDICMQLFKVFFIHVAPSHPIIDRANFIFQFAIPQRPPSWLLLQAVLFTAAGHCEDHLLKEAGFESRIKARMTLFKRAKALYDVDHEKDKFTIIQATFLMSLWWNSPVDAKDNCHWLGISINLALSIGMHRSTKESRMSLDSRRLYKKVWWTLYTEDKYLATTLGRPALLRSRECSVEPLEMADFDAEPYGFGDSFKVGLPKTVMAYPICLNTLAKIAERTIEYFHSTNYSPELCDGMLQVWEAGLPDFYQLKVDGSTDTIWPSMIRIAASWLRTLIYRTHLEDVFPLPFSDNAHQKAIEAAYQIVRTVEDILAAEKIRFCPVHIVPALYAAMSIFARLIQSDSSIAQRLAHVKYKVCIVALEELQVVWPISRWILSAFAENMSAYFAQDSV